MGQSQRYQAAVDGQYAAEAIGAMLREGIGNRRPEPEHFPLSSDPWLLGDAGRS